MSLNRELIENRKMEYTLSGGWIDWHHAVRDRSDVQKLWAQFPHKYRRPMQLPVKTSVFTDVNRKKYLNVVYQLDAHGLFKSICGQTSMVFTVPYPNSDTECLQYALYIFQQGNNEFEKQQMANYDFRHHSGFSFEDLFSDLLTFYMHVFGWNRSEVVRLCRGWQSQTIAKEKSLALYDKISENQRSIKTGPFKWNKVYLFNNLIEGANDKKCGWHNVPSAFSSVSPTYCFCSGKMNFGATPLCTIDYPPINIF